VEDFRDQLNDIVVDPRRMSHATRTHELFVHSIYESADTSNRRKRKRVTVAEPTKDHPDVAVLRAQLEGVKLKSWPNDLHSLLRLHISTKPFFSSPSITPYLGDTVFCPVPRNIFSSHHRHSATLWRRYRVVHMRFLRRQLPRVRAHGRKNPQVQEVKDRFFALRE
ncbi:hypothetical protein PHLCEN_2v4259, partial [Hermanssonia centrifuga]